MGICFVLATRQFFLVSCREAKRTHRTRPSFVCSMRLSRSPSCCASSPQWPLVGSCSASRKAKGGFHHVQKRMSLDEWDADEESVDNTNGMPKGEGHEICLVCG